MSNFVAGLTNDDPAITAPVYKQYRYVQYNGAVPASATVSVSFPRSDDMFRYVVIQQQFASNDAICFKEMQVLLRGSLICSGIVFINQCIKSFRQAWHTVFLLVCTTNRKSSA